MDRRHHRLVGFGVASGVLVGGMAAFAFDVGYRSLTVQLAPYVDASATYDSNAELRSADKGAGTYVQGQLGVSVGLIYKWLTINSVGYSFSRTYSSNVDPVDQEGLSGGERLDVSFGRRDKLQVGLNQSFESLRDYSEMTHPSLLSGDEADQTALLAQDWTDRVRRDVWRLGVMLGRNVTDKIGADLGYTYSLNDYRSSAMYDAYRHEAQLMLGYKVTDKSSVLLDGRYGIEDSQGYEDAGSAAYAGLGWTTHMTEKVSFIGSAGFESYESGVLTGRDQKSEVDTLGVHLGGTWRPVDKLAIGLSGQRGVEAAAFEPNTRDVTLIEASAAYRLLDDLSCSLALSCRRDDYDLPPPGPPPGFTEKRRLDSGAARVSVGWSPLRHVSLYASASYENTQSNLPGEDVDQARATVGARATF